MRSRVSSTGISSTGARPTPAGSPRQAALAPHLATLYQQGIALLRQGRLPEAEAPLRRLATQHPDHVPTLVLLGDCLRLQGRAAEAEAVYQNAVHHQPEAAVYNNLGMMQRVQGKLAEAVTSYRVAIALSPGLVAAHTNLGATLARMGHLAEAEVNCREAVRLEPQNPGANMNMGVVLQAQGQLAEASPFLERAVELQPKSAHACQTLAALRHQQERYADEIPLLQSALTLQPEQPQVWHDLGILQLSQELFADAATSFRNVLSRQPAHAEAHARLGFALEHLGNLAEAESSCRRAIEIDPELVAAYTCLASILSGQNQLEEALQAADTAQQLAPDAPNNLSNLAFVLSRLSRDAEALALLERGLDRWPDDPICNTTLAIIEGNHGQWTAGQRRLEQALATHPNHDAAHKTLADFTLKLGDLERGWAEYEWVLRDRIRSIPLREPVWHGESLQGKTILVWSEFGLGDTIQFMRYLPLLRAQGARVAFAHLPALAQLLQGFSGYDRLLPFLGTGTAFPVTFDVHIPLMGLPRLFNTTLDSIPATIPYLVADPDKRYAWQQRLATARGYRVGLVWAGNPRFAADRQRSAPLAVYEPLGSVPGTQLYSLQKGPGAAQLAQAPAGLTLTDLGQELDDLSDTAAAIMNLDLVITVDTSVAHLAGALGRPVWTLLPFNPDWRWLLEREDSPWYPTMRLFRQQQMGDWATVMEQVRHELDIYRANARYQDARDMG